MKVLIVGGVAGGASAAARLRRLDEHAEIILFEKGPYISFANCGLPYYLSRTIPEEEDLLLQTPESFYARFHVDVRVNQEVLSIDRAAKKITIKNVKTFKIYEENYDKLILSPGAAAIKPDSVPGLDTEGVFTLRSVPDVKAIDTWILEQNVKHVVVAGGGYIGVEAAENLAERGLKVTLVEFAPHIINTVDSEMAVMAEQELEKHHIILKLGCALQAVTRVNGKLHIATTDDLVEADMLLMSIGVTPNSELAKKAGLTLGTKNCISVNDKMQTNDPDIYAVGDAVEITEFVTGAKQNIALAGPANRQGRIAADQICGIDSRYKNTQGSAIMKVFDLAVASTGISEKTAQRLNLDYDKVYLHSGSHASYYPNGKPLSVKILFERNTGRLLGGQFVGADGADKRCDVLATAIRCDMKATDLIDLELCYAPPFNSAKDQLNMAGFAIENILTGKVKNYHWNQIHALDKDRVTLLDVRTNKEFENGHVPGFTHIPLHELRDRLQELPKDKPVFVHCFSGLRSYVACRILTGHGYDSYNISGGYYFYNCFKNANLLNE
ncbi:FAD-dependent oxidoreductase [Mediterraneibacter massiliensis]|jgi:NADPH-dependent 2,4-dienoyl-CoA reductase/sulfur reductase-like enzyme/rhodanese-related sulfurtransferase|uniref:FAD-dependent oxidoreductase n=1 Tax=Mediterraneibacter massiliensis TaxID=1720300 RepID=UPI0022E5EAAE|nr:FAD-dependent oxidoreductase [Mediterraneibacter massiliensis]